MDVSGIVKKNTGLLYSAAVSVVIPVLACHDRPQVL